MAGGGKRSAEEPWKTVKGEECGDLERVQADSALVVESVEGGLQKGKDRLVFLFA